MKQENNTTLIRKGINKLPMTPLYALLGCLEHCELPQSLAERLQERLTLECAQTDPDLFLIAALLRAMAGVDAQQLSTAIKAVLSQPALCHPEVLVAIAGRCWNGLTQADIASEFLLRLAQTKDQTLFNQLFTDLVMLPLLRGIMLQVLHSQANPELVAAITQLQQHARSQ